MRNYSYFFTFIVSINKKIFYIDSLLRGGVLGVIYLVASMHNYYVTLYFKLVFSVLSKKSKYYFRLNINSLHIYIYIYIYIYT